MNYLLFKAVLTVFVTVWMEFGPKYCVSRLQEFGEVDARAISSI